MVKLGVTGGIGSGKSFICRMMTQRGALLYEADREAKRLMNENLVIRQKLTDLLGSNVYLHDGSLNKPLVADFLFANHENAEIINSIVHPEVRNDFRRWTRDAESKADIALLEAAILYESGFDSEVDRTLMVYAPLKLRIERTVSRDMAEEESVRKRIGMQMNDEEKARKADFLIVNDGIRPLEPQIQQLMENLYYIIVNRK